MLVTFLYCIDFPKTSEDHEFADEVRGWLLCSHKINAIKISGTSGRDYILDYGSRRPDVTACFSEFSENEECGFIIRTGKEQISLKERMQMDIEAEIAPGVYEKINIGLDLKSSSIREIDFDSEQLKTDAAFAKNEKKFIDTLKKHPWITVRMDITNKCNLKCVMCHYKEKEIFSRPAKAVTADELKHQLADMGPFVRHIMLSCGFEPLVSKHFHAIVEMLRSNYPQMEIGMCTNGMLLDSKARKTIIEKNMTHVILSFDGVKKETLERIRIGAIYEKVLGNIMALHDLKMKYNRKFPLLFMDFVMMNSNIHEAPAFVEMCGRLGIEMIDFRHMVGNVFFSDHEEMLHHHREKYNHFRSAIIEKAKECKVNVRLPEAFADVSGNYCDEKNVPDLSDFYNVRADVQTGEIIPSEEIVINERRDSCYDFLSAASCLRPFNEIMITDEQHVLPCAYYSDIMGQLSAAKNLHSVFFSENFRRVRQRKLFSRFDHNCVNCPIRLNLLPTDITR